MKDRFFEAAKAAALVSEGVGKRKSFKHGAVIVKKNQVLMKLSSLDFSFIVEDSISELFKMFHEYKMKVDLIQNSAISFSVCVDNKFGRLDELLINLKSRFKVTCQEDVSLYTIRHFNAKAIESLLNGHEVLLEQRGNQTVQFVIK